MAEITRIYLARHGEPHNPEGVFYGHLPGFDLSPLGRRQAEALGDFLKDKNVVHAYASPLERALETARLAVGRLREEPVLEIREDLVETAFGKYIQGVPRSQAPFKRPLFWLHLVSPGALAFDETVETMARRVGRVVDEALETAGGASALLVSHADPVKAFINQQQKRADWRFHAIKLLKGSFYELLFEDDRLVHSLYHPPLVA